MLNEVLKYLVAGGIMAAIDAVWLSVVAKKFYQEQIGSLLLAKPNMIAAAAFYLIYVLGVLVFAINPAVEKGSWTSALLLGGLFGFVAYATYDLTNLATLKGFTNKVVVVDLIWGTLLTATVAALSYLVITKWIS